MPVPAAGGRLCFRQFVPAADPKYGGFSALTTEQYRRSGGRLWYDEDKEISQLRSVFMTGPESWHTQIESTTLVIEAGWCHRIVDGISVCAIGIALGPGSRYNRCQWLNDQFPKIATFVDVQAILSALTLTTFITQKHSRICDIKIRISSPWIIEILAWEWDAVPNRADELIGMMLNEDKEHLLELVNVIRIQWEAFEKRGFRLEFWLSNVELAEDLAEDLLLNAFGIAETASEVSSDEESDASQLSTQEFDSEVGSFSNLAPPPYQSLY